MDVGLVTGVVALVLAYYWFTTFAAFAEGPWMKPLAGVLLVLLGIYEYVSGHDHGHDDGGDDSDHDRETDRDRQHAHDHGHDRDHGHGHFDERHAEGGLRTLGVTALLLGFVHEEPIQILAICAGTERCLELMLVYSLAVICAILAPTLLLIAGYQSHRERIERYTPYSRRSPRSSSSPPGWASSSGSSDTVSYKPLNEFAGTGQRIRSHSYRR